MLIIRGYRRDPDVSPRRVKHHPVMDAIIRVNGAVKFGKTVLAPTSAALFAAFNGHFDYTQTKKSMQGGHVRVLPGGDVRTSKNGLKYLARDMKDAPEMSMRRPAGIAVVSAGV